MPTRRQVVFSAFMIAVLAGPARAGSDDTVLLTVTGPDGMREYTRADFEALGLESFSTTTIWSEGAEEFTGVSLSILLDSLDVQSGALSAKAINDYAVEIPVSDAVEGGPIIAFLRNGEEMSVRDKGPLWLIYPFDDNPDYQSEVIYSRSIWQLDRIEILP